MLARVHPLDFPVPDRLELLRRDRRGSAVAFHAGTIRPRNRSDKGRHNSAIAHWNDEPKKLLVGAVASWSAAALRCSVTACGGPKRQRTGALQNLAEVRTVYGELPRHEFAHGTPTPVSTIVPADAETHFYKLLSHKQMTKLCCICNKCLQGRLWRFTGSGSDNLVAVTPAAIK